MIRHSTVVSAVIIIVAILFDATAVHAQTPVVLVHGFMSDSSTWDTTATRLAGDFNVGVYRRDTHSFDTYETQADQVNSSFGSLGSGTIAIGHSNGGVVAREWSKVRSMEGLVTIGAPNAGAPIAINAGIEASFLAQLAVAVDHLFLAFEGCPGCSGGSLDYIYYELVSQTPWVANVTISAWTDALYSLAPNLTVVQEMAPDSSYFANLNSSGNLSGEDGRIQTRVGIISTAHNMDRGGVVQALDPGISDTFAYVRDVVAYDMQYYASYLLTTGNPYDFHVQDVISNLYTTAAFLFQMDQQWCTDVSFSYNNALYGWCYDNDAVVPYWSQYYQGAENLYIGNGPAHVQETSDNIAYSALYQAMTEYIGVAPNGPGGEGGGGDQMQADSAVRGCSNYVEWSPVFQPTSSDCLAYCKGYSADSCEWHISGSCYVEYGNGCYVTGGYSGWYAWVR
jgi:pimeloyl-ACP methyl ester carboxylesterase